MVFKKPINKRELMFWGILFFVSLFLLGGFAWGVLGYAYSNDVEQIKERGRDTLAQMQYVVPRIEVEQLQSYINNVYRSSKLFSYLLIMDTKGLALAHSDPSRKGMSFYEDGLQRAVATEMPIEQVYTRDADKPDSPHHGEKTIDIMAPTFNQRGEVQYVVNIGISLRTLEQIHELYFGITMFGVFIILLLIGIPAIFRFIAMRKHAMQIEGNQQNQRILLSNIQNQVWYLTDDRSYGDVNKAHADYLGSTIEALHGADLYDLFPKEIADDLRQGNSKVFATGQMTKTEEWVVNVKGERRLFSLIRTPKLDEVGQVEYVVCSAEDITDRKKAERELKESEETFRALTENSGDVIMRFDRQFRHLYVSPASEKLIGIPSDQFIGKTHEELGFDLDLCHTWWQAMQHVFETAEVIQIEFKIPNGVWIDWLLMPEFDSKGKVKYVITSARDISTRKQSEEILRESENKFKALIDNLNEAVALHEIVWDEVGKACDFIYLDCNPAYECLTKRAKSDLVGKRVSEVFPDLLQEWTPIFSEVVSSGEPTTLTSYSAYLNLHLEMRVYSPKENLVAVALSDITARVLSDREMRRNEQRLSVVLKGAGAGLWELDLKRNELTVDPAYAHMLGYQGAGLTVNLDEHTFHPEDQPSILKQLYDLQSGKASSFKDEYRVLTATGDYVWIYSWATILERDEAGKPAKLVGAGLDISDRKKEEEERDRLETQLRQAQKMESIGRLAGGVAHDFNNLLTGIFGNVSMARMDAVLDEVAEQAFDEIFQAAESAASLTRQLLAFSRKQMIEPRVLDVNDLISNLSKMLRRLIGEDIELKFTPKPDTGNIRIDPGQAEQILVNLAVNARDAMPDGGKLTMEVANVVLDESYLDEHAHSKPGEYVMLAVSDNGIGMDEEVRSQIFEPFFTTKGKGKGTGLGLATVFGIVKQNNGNIEVYSEPGVGTTFKAYFPRVHAEVESLVKKVEKELITGNETLVLVEDEPMVRKLGERALVRHGYKVYAYPDGDHALEELKALDAKVDLLITDVVMPGVSGKVLAEKVREMRPGTKVLFTSGYTEDAIAHHGVLDEGIQFIGKPFTPRKLAEKVREVLDG